jgi:hypothetical protein
MDPKEQRGRLLEAAAALLEATPSRRLLTVSLNKGLFYLDLVCLRDCGETFTKNSYVALQMGPVVAKYNERLIVPLKEEGIAEQQPSGNAKPVKLLRVPEFQWATEDVRRIAKKVSRWCHEESSAVASEYSHGNQGWLIARENERRANGRKQTIDLNIAMQQIITKDPWLDEPLSATSLKFCAAAITKKGNTW